MKLCVVVPHFDHVAQLRCMLNDLADLRIPLIVVDDGSPYASIDLLSRELRATVPDSVLIRHTRNWGKGAAVATGLRAARDAGYTHAVQIDADGQHDCADIPALCAAAANSSDAVICGEPTFGSDISKLRYYARYITLYLIWLETLSTAIRDALCGMRLYPLDSVVNLLDGIDPPKRMAFDPEILVRAVWAGIPLQFIPIRVCYPLGGTSHFHYVRDNLEIAWMHTRLICGMPMQLPRLISRNYRTGQRRPGAS